MTVRVHSRKATRRGAALLTALMTIAVLAGVTAMAGRAARDGVAITVNDRAQAVARTMAESAVLAARVQLERRLADAPDSAARDAVFDDIESDGTPWVSDTLGDGVFAASLVNVSARLDVNEAEAEGLTALFRTVAPQEDAAAVARLLAAAVRGEGARPVSRGVRDSLATRDSLEAVLLGRERRPPMLRPFTSLDEVEALLDGRAPWIAEVASDLTVDGDGRVDRRHASRRVLAAAAGSLVDRPTRLLIVARGWQAGTAITQEIQAVYAIEGTELRLVRWREQDR